MPSFTVATGVTDTTPKTVSNNDVGLIESGGTLSAATAITWTGGSNTPGVIIDNFGSILGSTRAIDSSGAFPLGGSITVNNHADAIISATGNDGWRINNSLNAGGTVRLNNDGSITSAGGQALDFNAITSVNATIEINNTGTHSLDRQRCHSPGRRQHCHHQQRADRIHLCGRPRHQHRNDQPH